MHYLVICNALMHIQPFALDRGGGTIGLRYRRFIRFRAASIETVGAFGPSTPALIDDFAERRKSRS